ncbi:hypothetical protein HDU98_010363 [Podochytrium sp. JEL0797]|nr:hypothetical protein HDU98_010363 [Podochytrium sp. JEL0797]
MKFSILSLALAASNVAANYGKLTWFGSSWSDLTVACGKGYPPMDNSLFAAVSVYSLSDQSSILNSNVCGSCIKLYTDAGSVVVTVVDVMLRSDANSQDLDLSTAAFSDVVAGGIDVGVSYANWDWVDCSSGWAPAPPKAPVPQPESLPVPGPAWGGIADWMTCGPSDSCASPSYVCCVAPADVWNGKTTCRPNTLANCASVGSSNGVENWMTCGYSDTCADPSYVCCVAPEDNTNADADMLTSCKAPTLDPMQDLQHPVESDSPPGAADWMDPFKEDIEDSCSDVGSEFGLEDGIASEEEDDKRSKGGSSSHASSRRDPVEREDQQRQSGCPVFNPTRRPRTSMHTLLVTVLSCMYHAPDSSPTTFLKHKLDELPSRVDRLQNDTLDCFNSTADFNAHLAFTNALMVVLRRRDRVEIRAIVALNQLFSAVLLSTIRDVVIVLMGGDTRTVFMTLYELDLLPELNRLVDHCSESAFSVRIGISTAQHPGAPFRKLLQRSRNKKEIMDCYVAIFRAAFWSPKLEMQGIRLIVSWSSNPKGRLAHSDCQGPAPTATTLPPLKRHERGRKVTSIPSTKKLKVTVRRCPCNKCDKSFTKAAGLRDHDRVHTGEKPFKYELSGKCFTRNSHVKRHAKTCRGL